MGIMSALFGGTKTINTNTPEIEGIARGLVGFNPGKSAGEKYAKHNLQSAREGRMADLPSVQLAMAQGSRNWTDLQRQLQMSSAMMPGEQSGLTQGILSKGYLQNQNDTGFRSLQGAANDIGAATQASLAGWQSRNQMMLQGQMAGGQMLQNGLHTIQTPGAIKHIADIAGIAGSLIPGLGMMGGGMKAGASTVGSMSKGMGAAGGMGSGMGSIFGG